MYKSFISCDKQSKRFMNTMKRMRNFIPKRIVHDISCAVDEQEEVEEDCRMMIAVDCHIKMKIES